MKSSMAHYFYSLVKKTEMRFVKRYKPTKYHLSNLYNTPTLTCRLTGGIIIYNMLSSAAGLSRPDEMAWISIYLQKFLPTKGNVLVIHVINHYAHIHRADLVSSYTLRHLYLPNFSKKSKIDV